VCLIEKGSHIGAHILSGNVFEPRAFNELFPDWQKEEDEDLRAPLHTPVTNDSLLFLRGADSSFPFPQMMMPKSIDNHGNFIISLGRLCEWMNDQAEELGVEVLPGIAGDKVIFNEDGSVGGVVTGDFGIAKDGS
jgi:electron-transferring-flavoprotein dehydrogenase